MINTGLSLGVSSSPVPYLTTDRFGNLNSAVALNGGYLQAPTNIYFANDLTAMAWIKLNNYGSNSPRLFDFGNGPNSDNVFFTVNAQGGSNVPVFEVCNAGTCISCLGVSVLPLGVWVHVAATLSGDLGSIYINGAFSISQSGLSTVRNVNRTQCYIGKSNWADPNADIIVDELKFFNVSLNANQVMAHYNENMPYVIKLN
jgi:arabinan endo-1,5-alpha-L-arabinosidase